MYGYQVLHRWTFPLHVLLQEGTGQLELNFRRSQNQKQQPPALKFKSRLMDTESEIRSKSFGCKLLA
jgi:hypothetical protein